MATIARAAGGPAVSVRRLVEGLSAPAGRYDCEVFAGDAVNSRPAAADWRGGRLRLFPLGGPARLGWARGMMRQLATARPALIHLHGLWQFHAFAAGRAARRHRVPLVVSPRGMLEPWALSRGRLQKRAANLLFQRRLLRDAACVVATSRLEAAGVRAAGFATPVAVVPNGIDLPAAREVGPSRDGRRRVLFLSRLEPKKGVLELLAAWQRLRPEGWMLVVAGPDERGFAGTVAARVAALGLQDCVELPGPLWGEAKAQALAAADLFALPSHSENFGLAIGEALAAGLPVITTRATPWEEIATERCGWWIDTGVDPLVGALREALALAPATRAEMGRRGRDVVAHRYSWARVAEQMSAVYDWVLADAAARPADPPFSCGDH